MARRAPLFSPVAQLSGSAFCGKRTTPTFCRSFCRFSHTPCFPKALVPVALRAPHPLPHSPRFHGEWGWERPPSILRMDGPETGGFCRPSCRLRGRSQPAPPARVIPAGRQLRDDGATPAPALLEFLEDPAHAPHHSPHRGLRRALPHAPLRRVPGPADVPILDFNALEHPLFPGFAGFSIPPRARIGIVSRITTRGSPARRPPHTDTAERLRRCYTFLPLLPSYRGCRPFWDVLPDVMSTIGDRAQPYVYSLTYEALAAARRSAFPCQRAVRESELREELFGLSTSCRELKPFLRP